MQRERRKLDMLPLLDVFMVILFVFATIQEGRLESTTEDFDMQSRELDSARAEAQELQDIVEQAQVEEKQERLKKTELALKTEREENTELTAELDQKKKNVEELEKENEERLEMIEELLTKAKIEMERAFDSEDEFRQQDILEKLLDQHSVFEIEIQGRLEEQGIVNNCCYRSDPRSSDWHGCGAVPATAIEREQWFRNGADGLIATLRKTKGGNTMTIIRQNAHATHQIGAKVEAAVRDLVPEQKVYNEGITVAEIKCGGR